MNQSGKPLYLEPVEGARFSVRNAAGETLAEYDDILDAMSAYKLAGDGAQVWRSDGVLMATLKCAMSGSLPKSRFGPTMAVVSVTWGSGSGIRRRVA